MRQAKDHTGQKYGLRTVLGRDWTRKDRCIWRWRCVCGKEGSAEASALRATRSCGCNLHLKKPGRKRKSGESPEYQAWASIRDRCFNPKTRGYENYGGRGITMHPDWVNDFSEFLSHVGRRPSPTHQLDRIDNNGHYEPGNVRWTTRKQNNRNRRNNNRIQAFGREKCLVEWAEEIGISKQLLRARIYELGWTPERAITTPVRSYRRCPTMAA